MAEPLDVSSAKTDNTVTADYMRAEVEEVTMAEGRALPDYELEDSQVLERPEQFKAIGDPTRQKILGLLSERAATTSQLAEALGQPKGTLGHHLKVLEAAGLLRVVRTRQVRAMTEKYYGRVARTFNFRTSDSPASEQLLLLDQAIKEFAPSPPEDHLPMYLIRHARIPASHAREFADRVLALAEEFDRDATAGGPVHAFVAGVYRTDWPELPGPAEEA